MSSVPKTLQADSIGQLNSAFRTFKDLCLIKFNLIRNLQSKLFFFDKYVYWSSHSKVTFLIHDKNLYYTSILYEWVFEQKKWIFKINFSSNIYTLWNTLGTFNSYNKS